MECWRWVRLDSQKVAELQKIYATKGFRGGVNGCCYKLWQEQWFPVYHLKCEKKYRINTCDEIVDFLFKDDIVNIYCSVSVELLAYRYKVLKNSPDNKFIDCNSFLNDYLSYKEIVL